MSVRLILVRHGETDWNKVGKLQGISDVSLNKKGAKQIQKTAIKLKRKGEKPDIIITSGLLRHVQSAVIFAFVFQTPLFVNNGLVERNLGELEGKTWKEACKLYGSDLKIRDGNQGYDYRPYGGEHVIDVSERLLDFLYFIKKNYKDKTVVVLTSAGILRLLFLWYPRLKKDFRRNIKPGEYFVLEI